MTNLLFSRFLILPLVSAAFVTTWVIADERRAPRPKFPEGEGSGVFFGSLEEAFRGGVPDLAKLRAAEKKAAAAEMASAAGGSGDESASGGGSWTSLVSATSVEDEVKRLRLHYETVVSTPGAFNGGGYLEARLDLSVLATLFAVISDYSGDIRWKKDAPAARDLIARTAYNCKAGSTQVYNEAKLRKADLEDLVSGGGISDRDAEAANDWSSIVDRSPLMEYLELLIDALEDDVRDQKSYKAEVDRVKRNAELLSMVGEVLVQEGMDEADDEDYTGLSNGMTQEAVQVVKALGRDDYDAVREGVAKIRQRCDACHEQYR
ncbi:cytochrome c [Rubripirellula sp.]|jgi:cytochrome c556|nr:cytochrome c [Rubripirellula sp.]